MIEINDLMKGPLESINSTGQWRPARPIPGWGLGFMIARLKDAWWVIIGKAEAIYWKHEPDFEIRKR
jgi:hypothetical protein